MFDNPFGMVVAIVLIVAIARVITARHKAGLDWRGNEMSSRQSDPDADRLRDEVKALKERVAVLERLATDSNSTSALDREFEKLRKRDDA